MSTHIKTRPDTASDNSAELKTATKWGRVFINCFLLLALSILIGGCAITAANYLPVNSRIRDRSLSQLQADGMFPEAFSVLTDELADNGFQTTNPTALELATDNLILKMVFYDGEDSGLIQAFRCYSTQYEEEYSRYWHGYVVVLRLLFLLFNYKQIRLINGLCQLLIFASIFFLLLKRKRIRYAIAFACSYLLLTPLALALCLQYTPVFYCAFGGLLIYLIFQRHLERGNRYLYFFFLLGIVTIYLDLMTYPLVTWGLVIVWWLLLQERPESVGASVLKVIFSALAWVAGYAGMWVGKWIVGSLVLRENLFSKAFSEALLWTVNEGNGGISWKERFEAVFLNWQMYSYGPYLAILCAWLLYALIRGICKGYTRDSRIPALALVGCSSIVWCLTLASHSDIHRIFVHRIFVVSVSAFTGIILLAVKKETRFFPTKKIVRNSLFAAATALTSFALALQLRTNYSVDNFQYEYDKILISKSVSMDFVPAFDQVRLTEFGFSVENGTAGTYLLSLSDRDGILYEYQIPIREWARGNLHIMNLDWDLKRGTQYTLQLTLDGNDGDTYLWVSTQKETNLTEYGATNVDGTPVSGQMLTKITYWCRPVGAILLLFWTATCLGIILMTALTCKNLPRPHKSQMLPDNTQEI